jgi:hypothetical protein
MSFEGQGQTVLCQQKALVPSNIMCKYEQNRVINKKVMANVKAARHQMSENILKKKIEEKYVQNITNVSLLTKHVIRNL